MQARRSLTRRKTPRTLYVYSDMLQHADWYSHFDLDWTQWRTEYTARQDAVPSTQGGMAVEVLYLPRQDITEPLRPRRVHQEFWRVFFDGAEVSFADYDPVPGYAWSPLMDAPASDVAEEDDPALDEERARIEELRERLRTEAAALAEQREQSIAAREHLASAEQALEAEPSAEGAASQDATPSPETALPEEADDSAPAASEPSAPPPAAGNDQASTQELPDALPVAPPPQPAIDAVDPPPPTLELASAATDESAPCPATLGASSQASLTPGGYPGGERVNYGAGVLVFDYAMDNGGGIVGNDVVLRRELSTSEMPEHFDALVADTIEQIMAWQFEFAETDGNCARAQRGSATFTYASRCVGAPRPSCWTVRTSVALR